MRGGLDLMADLVRSAAEVSSDFRARRLSRRAAAAALARHDISAAAPAPPFLLPDCASDCTFSVRNEKLEERRRAGVGPGFRRMRRDVSVGGGGRGWDGAAARRGRRRNEVQRRASRREAGGVFSGNARPLFRLVRAGISWVRGGGVGAWGVDDGGWVGVEAPSSGAWKVEEERGEWPRAHASLRRRPPVGAALTANSPPEPPIETSAQFQNSCAAAAVGNE